MPDMVVGAKNIVMNKTDKFLIMEIMFQVSFNQGNFCLYLTEGFPTLWKQC